MGVALPKPQGDQRCSVISYSLQEEFKKKLKNSILRKTFTLLYTYYIYYYILLYFIIYYYILLYIIIYYYILLYIIIYYIYYTYKTNENILN